MIFRKHTGAGRSVRDQFEVLSGRVMFSGSVKKKQSGNDKVQKEREDNIRKAA